VLIAALLLYLVFRGTDKIHYQIPELKTIDVNTLTKIEISMKTWNITLVKKDNQWFLDPQGFPVEESVINDIKNNINDLALTELASKAKNYVLYDLGEDKAIHIKVYRNDEVLRDFNLGKSASTYNHSFVKLAGDDRVFYASQIYRVNFDKPVKDFRSKSVMKFDKNEISEIFINLIKEGKKFQFTKAVKPAEAKKDEKQPTGQTGQTPEAETTWIMTDGKEGNSGELNTILGQLSDFRCDQFIEGKTKEEFNTPIYVITLKGKKDYILSISEKIGPEPKDGEGEPERYPAVSSENSYPFLLNDYSTSMIMKKPEDLLKK
jgi:hypothetical protein